MNKKTFQNILIILMLFTALPLWTQEENKGELTETEKQKILAANHDKTGIEIYFSFPLPIYMPGWSYSSKSYGSNFKLTLPGVNISYANICFGVDMDFDSSKDFLKDMGIGMALEWNFLDSLNMDGMDVTLFQSYAYLFYSVDTARFSDYYFRAGIGIARISNEDLFSSDVEKDSPRGPLIMLEAGSSYPALGNFKFYSGISYKYIPINSKNIHVLAPFLRTSFRF
ncbi:MAG: hypothetical protein B6241_01670 [Spirochaetaceae bacterium 4572_59]|nr:MAG: hypothetical protein B6241_01670 [Spirochaetaceae bacterium 4572_59]